ncbi:MAG: hypothetical protein R3F41_08945 [Gammaproteobacteria bacterium]|nr:hypothetical protein [Pseudomonadales bacterium]MCP5347726.1 hypothetical protein [Pseudomonadales bacterium]
MLIISAGFSDWNSAKGLLVPLPEPVTGVHSVKAAPVGALRPDQRGHSNYNNDDAHGDDVDIVGTLEKSNYRLPQSAEKGSFVFDDRLLELFFSVGCLQPL